MYLLNSSIHICHEIRRVATFFAVAPLNTIRCIITSPREMQFPYLFVQVPLIAHPIIHPHLITSASIPKAIGKPSPPNYFAEVTTPQKDSVERVHFFVPARSGHPFCMQLR
jgi:hypothetical protein